VVTEPICISGAIHLSHHVSELETGLDHAFLVGLFFIVSLFILSVMLQEGREAVDDEECLDETTDFKGLRAG
jgi:hypothetical protein